MYTIPTQNLATVQEHVARLNRRAARLGKEPVVLTIGEPRAIEVYSDRLQRKVVRTFVDVSVAGSPPKLNGWSFIAAVEVFDDLNLIRAVPGEVIPQHYRTTGSQCEHCNTARRRKDVFVLRHEDGRLVQVGRQCIRDFLGHVSADEVAARATYLASLDELLRDAEGSESLTGERHEDLLHFLTYTAAAIRNFGWVSKGQARDTGKLPTAEIVSIALRVDPGHRDYIEVEDADRALAQAALDWAQAIPGTTENDYLANVAAVARQGFIATRAFGIAASIISAYNREQSRKIEAKVRQEKGAASTFVGTVGTRSDFVLTVVRVLELSGVYGVTFLHLFDDAEGNQFRWFASSERLDQGKTVVLKGTIKAHEDYKGIKTTVLTRCKVAA
jgi:hypothetical protein